MKSKKLFCVEFSVEDPLCKRNWALHTAQRTTITGYSTIWTRSFLCTFNSTLPSNFHCAFRAQTIDSTLHCTLHSGIFTPHRHLYNENWWELRFLFRFGLSEVPFGITTETWEGTLSKRDQTKKRNHSCSVTGNEGYLKILH